MKKPPSKKSNFYDQVKFLSPAQLKNLFSKISNQQDSQSQLPKSKELENNEYESEEFKFVSKCLSFKKNLCKNRPCLFYHKKCKKCKTIVLGKDKEPLAFLRVCSNSFCKNKICFDHRFDIAKQYFSLFFNAYKSWRTKRGSRWIHESFGFARQSIPTRKEIANMRRRLRLFFKSAERKFKIRIRGIGIKDLTHDVKKIGEEFFIHFHFARRPTKFIKKETWQKLANKYHLQYNWIGYRDPFCIGGLLNYFSKRHAGYFGHKKKQTNFMFADVLSVEQYCLSFYNTRKAFLFGFTRKEIQEIKERAKSLSQNESFVLVNNSSLNTDQNTCQNCAGQEFSYEEIPEETEKPPPPPPKSKIPLNSEQKPYFEVEKL